MQVSNQIQATAALTTRKYRILSAVNIIGMVHISFWLMRMMLMYWEEMYMRYRKTQKL
jgi:hypothetical protein